MSISNIEASLSNGRLFTGKWQGFIYFSLFFPLIMPLLTIFMLVLTFTVGMDWDNMTIFVFVFLHIFCALLFLLVFFSNKKNRQLKKNIILWLEDAVETKAYSKEIGRIGVLFMKQVKIQLRFKIGGITYKRESLGKMLGGNPIGYHKIFTKYADKEINILYSQKYDEVLIIKDRK